MKAKRVLLIGWDAADWKVIDNLIERGHMPTLKKMVENGVRGNLSTLQPVLSPMLWSSIATGKFADKHGIHGFTEPDYEAGMVRPITSTSRKAKAIWNILTHQGKKSNIFSWWPSNPAEPINGIMVSNLYQRANKPISEPWPMADGTVHPEDLSDRFKRLRIHPEELTSAHVLPFIPKANEINQEKDHKIAAFSKMLADAATVHAASTWAMENTEWDFTAVYHDAIDHACHGFMKFRAPQLPGVPDDMFDYYQHVVDGMYRFHDMMLERLLELAGPDTNVILISDHGFQSDHLRPLRLPKEPAGPAAEHRQHGIICCFGPDFKKGQIIHGASILDVTPTLLALYGLPVGKDMDGTPLLQAFEETPSVKTIDSWENVEGHFGEHDTTRKVTKEEAKAAVKQLVELGYIEDPGDNIKEAMKNTDIELKYNLSKVYASTGRPDQSYKLLEEINRQKREYRFESRMAEALNRLGKHEEALKLVDEIEVQIEKDNKELQTKKAEEAKLSKEELKEKREKEAIPRHKIIDDPEIHKRRMAMKLLRVDVLKAKNEHQKALAILQELSSKAPNSLSILRSLADCLMLLEQWKEAIKVYKNCLAIDPNDHLAFRGIAFCENKLKNYEAAIDAALSATELFYHYPSAHYLLGEALYNLKQYDYAAQSLNVTLNMRPTHTAARMLLDKMTNDGLLSASQASEVHVEEMDSKEIKSAFNELAEKASNTKSFKGRKLGDVIVVSGLPRSGTSLMMQMLDAGGVDIYTDEVREADENNPKGFYEHEKVKALAKKNAWVKEARNKAMKVVSPLIRFLPPNHHYKVVVMKRDINEVTLSQHKMLIRLGKAKQTDSYPLSLEKTLTKQYVNALEWMKKQPNVEFIEIDYHETLADPMSAAERLGTFLDKKLDMEAMCQMVDKGLYRSKTSKAQF